MLEDAEGKSDDGLWGFEGDGMAVGLGLDADVAGVPVDAFYESVKEEVAACCGESFGEELGETVVACADSEDAVPFGGVFGCLLEAEGEGADDAVVGGVEAFNVADDGWALVCGDLFQVEVVGEGEVGLGPAFEFVEDDGGGVAFVFGGDSAVFEADG